MRRGRRMGRPGLVGTMARTAVVAGTATAVAGGVSRRQQGKAQAAAAGQQTDAAQQQQIDQMQAQLDQTAAAQQAAAAPAPAPAAGGMSEDAISQLKELAALKEQGILTEEEFAAQKAKILG